MLGETAALSAMTYVDLPYCGLHCGRFFWVSAPYCGPALRADDFLGFRRLFDGFCRVDAQLWRLPCALSADDTSCFCGSVLARTILLGFRQCRRCIRSVQGNETLAIVAATPSRASPQTRRAASSRATPIPRSRNCPISRAFSTRLSTCPTARLKLESTAITCRVHGLER